MGLGSTVNDPPYTLDCLRPLEDLETEDLEIDDFPVAPSRDTKDFLRPMCPIELRVKPLLAFAFTRLSATGPRV